MARNEITSSGRREQETKPSVLITAENNDSIEIANNFIHKNFQGGIHVNTKSSSVKCTILNNVINFNINGSESILLKSPDDASPHVTIAGNKLVQNNLNQSVDLLHVKNFRAEIIENVFLGNLMRYVLNWDTSYSGKGLGICEKNTFSMNAGYLQTIVLQGSKKVIKKNYIVNPGNYFEIAVFPNYHVTDIADQFDARFNWWGYDSRDDIQKRIRDTSSRSDIPVVVVDPFLVTPPETFNRGRTTLTWISYEMNLTNKLIAEKSRFLL